MGNEEKHFSFMDGMPTKPDVDAILKKYPDMEPGWRINRDQLPAVVGQEYASSRWKSIFIALQSRLRREKSFVLMYDRSTRQYFIARAADAIGRTSDVFKSVGRKLGSHRKNLVATIGTATEAERPVVEHQSRLAHILEREVKKQNMNLIPQVKVVDSPVQIQPPKVGGE